MTNQEYLEKYLEILKLRNSSPITINNSKKEVKTFLKYLDDQGIDNLTKLTSTDLDEYQTFLYHYRTKKGKPLAPVSQLTRLSALKNFFRTLVTGRYLIYNPAQSLQFPKIGKNLPRIVLNPKEITRILALPDLTTIYGYRDRAILETLYSTGIRLTELVNLNPDNADTAKGYLTIIKGKGRRDRTIPLGEIACGYLKEYITKVRPHLIKPHSTGTLFLSRTGRPYECSGMINKLRSYAKLAGIDKKITTKTFRITVATTMLRKNADLRRIQEMLGHKSLSTTQLYLQVIKNDLKKVHRKTHPREQESKENIHYKGGDNLE